MKFKSRDGGIMSGEAKWTWHSVLTISGGTCLVWLQKWSKGGAAGPLGK